MVSTPAPTTTLDPIGAEPRPLAEWLTTFHLASVVLDPYTNESSWILQTAARILRGFAGAAVRVNFVITASDDEARAFLGPLAKEFLVFADPDRAFVRSIFERDHPGTADEATINVVSAVRKNRRRRSNGFINRCGGFSLGQRHRSRGAQGVFGLGTARVPGEPSGRPAAGRWRGRRSRRHPPPGSDDGFGELGRQVIASFVRRAESVARAGTALPDQNLRPAENS